MTYIKHLMRLTFAAEEILLGAPGSVVTEKRLGGAVRGVDAVPEAPDALLPQQPHEELQADEGEHAEAKDGEDHDICQLPHRLDQSAHDGFQAFTEEGRTEKSHLGGVRRTMGDGSGDGHVTWNDRDGF